MAAPKLTGAGVEVFAQIYSGKEDPSWTLSAAQISVLASKLADMRPSTRRPIKRSGYDGFLLACAVETGLPSHIRVTQGLVSTPFTNNDIWYEDADRLESWLLTLLNEQPFADEVRSAMTGEIRAPRNSPGHRTPEE
jgi:hypothetical protein